MGSSAMTLDTISAVKFLNVISNSSSSIVQVGDRENSTLYNQGLSVLRSTTNHFGNAPYFDQYQVFTADAPPLDRLLSKDIHIIKEASEKIIPLQKPFPDITVSRINVISSSSSCNIQIGNGKSLYAENREKSFIQFLAKKRRKKGYLCSP